MVASDDSSADSSLEIYKYRRREHKKEPIFMFPPDSGINPTPESGQDEKAAKIYAVLQEKRGEKKFQRLRFLFLLYNTNSWKVFIIGTLFFAYILDMWLYAFCDIDNRPFGYVLIAVSLDCAFTADVIFVVTLKISRKWRKTLNLVEEETFKVVLDCLVALPYSILYFVRIESFDLYAIVPLASMIREYRILEYFYNKSSQAGSNQWNQFLLQYLMIFLHLVHTFACIWYLLAYQGFEVDKIRTSWTMSSIHLPTEKKLDWYIVSAYWSIMFLTTNCLGDLYPLKTVERVCGSLAVIFGFLLTSIVFVGSLNSQFITITTRRSKYVSQLKKIKNHLKLINMDADDSRRIIRYYEDLWYQKSGVFEPAFLELLPPPLKMEIMYDLNAVPLYSSLIFRKLPEPFIRRLSLSMTHQFYLPGDIVYNHNNNKTIMVCITKGVLELLSDEDDESPMISFTKGTCFGEISLVYNIPARCTVKAATYVECQVLQKKEFMKLMITYPDIVDVVRSEVQERINRSLQRKNVQENNGQLTLNIYASKFKKKSSIKCLKDKLRYIQGKTDEDLLNRDDQLDEYSLDLYLISEHTKKTDMNFICLNTSFPWILDSECNLVKIWTAYMLLIVFYICLLYPYFLGYLREFPDDIFFYIDIIISISLVVNVIMNCCTAVKTKKMQLKKFKAIVAYRMNTLGFYLDLVAIIPFEFLVTAEIRTYRDLYREHLFYLCKGIKLCLVWRLSSFFENLERNLLVNTILIKICKYIVYIFLLCYWCGVALYLESCYISRCYDNSWFSMALMSDTYSGQRRARNPKTKYPYLTAMYLATTLLLSIGYGDFVPGDQFDMAIIAFLSIYGVILMGYCVAEFSSLITHWSRTKTAFLEVVFTIDKFMKDNNFNSTIQSRIMAFYELQWQYNSGVEITGESWLHKTVVPVELQKKVLHQARFKALTSIKFFQVKNKAFIHTITEKAKEIILPPGEIVYNGGTVTRELYIIESGYCVVAGKDGLQQKIGRNATPIGPGNHLGLLVLLYGVPSLNTVYTLTHCKLLCIDHWAYTSALSLFPDMKEHEGLVTQAELESITKIAEAENAQRTFQQVLGTKTKKERIAHTLQNLFDGSFISLLEHYRRQNKSYYKSYKQFGSLRTIAPYVLLPYAIKPDGLFIICWTFLRTAAAFLICLLVPIIVAMAPLCTTFNKVIVVLEVICYIDMYVRLHVAFYGPKNQLIYHPYLTAKNYLTGPFILDIITCFPWYVFMVFLAPKHTEGHSVRDHMVNPHFYHCAFRLINVCQIYKLHIAFWTDTVSALKRAYLMSVLQFLILTLFFLNFYTAILITVSCRYVSATDVTDFRAKVQRLSLRGPYMHTVFYPGGNMVCQKGSWIDTPLITNDEVLSPARVYLFALYWTTGSFNGAAFGDFTAQDTSSLMLSIIVTLQGSFFFGYVYATIASLKAVADQVTTRFQENLKHLDMFLTREKVSITLKKSVLDYFKYQWKRTAGWSHQSILGKLHANLNEDAVLFMYEKTLRDIPLFEGVEYSFFRAFAKNLKERYFQKGHLVMRESEVISNMYIIYRGKVDIITKDNELETCMGPGGIFGNIRGAAKYFTLSNVIASRNIDLLCIDGAEFYALLKSYPAVLKKVQESIGVAVKDYVIPVISADRSSGDNYDFERVNDANIEEEEDDDIEYHIYETDVSTGSAEKSYGSRYSHSVSSIGNTTYMTAGKLFLRPDRWFRTSIVPEGTWVSFFEYLTLSLSYIDFFLLTYQMAYMSIPYFIYICIFMDLIFIYKIFLDMHCGYMNRYGDYVLEPRKVRNMYFSKTYLRRRDILVNIHLSYLIFAFPFPENNLHSFFTYLRAPQLFRITYLLTYKSHRKLNIGTANLFFKLAYMGVWASVITHINACVFFRLSCMSKEHCNSVNWMAKKTLNLRVDLAEERYFALYIAALWYTLNVLTICGTGDITSQNDIEIMETIILTILIKFSTGLLISEVSAMITAHNSSLIEYDYGINELRDGLRDMGLSQHQMTKMWDYVRELWNRQQGQQMPELIQELPQRLQSQIMEAVYGYHINISLIFSKTDEHFKRMLCTWLRHCVFFPGNYIVQCGDADQCIYFIHRGEVEVLTVHQNLTESIYDILGPEDSFGIAQGLYVGVAHHFSFRARTVVDIVYLQLDQWKYLLDFYPKAAKIVTRKVENIYVAS